MREILTAAIEATIRNIGIIASAEPDKEKRDILVRQLAEATANGIQTCKSEMGSILYDHEKRELDATSKLLRKTYCSDTNSNK